MRLLPPTSATQFGAPARGFYHCQHRPKSVSFPVALPPLRVVYR
ncbi:Uncharacterised protein [Vibrio cholerae]|nr:Uncharacterised protein [Vibrio cholerae]